MPQENVEIVRRACAFEFDGRGGPDDAVAIFAPDFVIPLEEGPSYGLGTIRDNIERWKSAWEELDVTAEEFIDAGERVLVTAHHRGARGMLRRCSRGGSSVRLRLSVGAASAAALLAVAAPADARRSPT